MEPVKSRPPTEDGGFVGVCPNSRQLELIAMTVVGELEMGIEGSVIRMLFRKQQTVTIYSRPSFGQDQRVVVTGSSLHACC